MPDANLLTDDAPPHHSPDAILVHPCFMAARTAYVNAILGLYENDAFMNRLVVEAGRALVFFNILSLHAAWDKRDRATWPTMRLLQDTVARFGVSSARRVHDIVVRFIATGYLESHAAPSDRRARVLTPTDKALAHDREWLAAHYKPLQIMFPDPGYGAPMGRDRAYQKAHRVVGAEFADYGARLMANNPGVMLFMGRDAGMMILMELVQLATEGPDEASRRISFADIAERFGVSRTHVRKTLQDAEKAGLVRLSNQSVSLMSPVVAAFDRFVADTMAGHDLMFRIAMRRLDRARVG